MLTFTLLLYYLFASVASVNVVWLNDNRNKVANDTLGPLLQSLQSQGTVGQLFNSFSNASEFPDMNSVCQAIQGEQANVIIDTTLAGRNADAVRSLATTIKIPTLNLAYQDAGFSSTEKSQVYIRPPGDLLADSIRQVVSMNNISNAAILFDDTFVMDLKYRSLLQNVPVRHLINRMKMDDASIQAQLNMMTNIDLCNMFLLGTRANIQSYLNNANQLNFYTRKYAWFGISKDDLNQIKMTCSNCSVVTLYPNITLKDPSKGIDAAFYTDTVNTAIKAAKDLALTTAFTCNDTSNPDVDFASMFAKDYTADKSTQPFLPNWPLSVNIKKQSVRGGQTFIENIGSYSSATSMVTYNGQKTLADFPAKTIYNVVTVVQPPFVYYANGTFSGYCIDLIIELKKIMDFEYELYLAPDGEYGNMDDQGNWNGMVKELMDRNADIALGAFAVMAERETEIDFTVPYYDLVGITILMKKPVVPTSLFKFLSVLEDSVWGCILAAYFVTSVLMWIFDRWSPYSYQNNTEKYKDDEEKRFFNLKECLWFCMTSLTPQGGGEAPKNLSGRLVAATWWLFGFIIIASYTANLAAFLTVSRLETPVEGLDDLSKQYKIQYAPENNSATMTYFQRMAYIEEQFYEIWKDMSLNDSLSKVDRAKLAVWDYPVSDKYTKIWQSMKEGGFPQSFDEALARVRASPSSSEGFAYIGDATDIRYQVLTNCDLQMVGDEFSRKPYAVAVQQGSPLKDQFNDAILKLLNQRKLETLKERWWNQNPNKQTCQDDDDSGGGISIYNIGGVFIVIFVGIGLAIITLVFEYWYYKYRKPASRVGSNTSKPQIKEISPYLGGKKGLDDDRSRAGIPPWEAHGKAQTKQQTKQQTNKRSTESTATRKIKNHHAIRIIRLLSYQIFIS